MLTSAITALNDPYFVDIQRDLAQLIAAIYIHYAFLSGTPRAVLLSLDGLTEAKIDRMQGTMFAGGGGQPGKEAGKVTVSERTQRGLVLDLLEGVRGVSVSEMGKVKVGIRGGARKKGRSDMMEKFVSGDGGASGGGGGGADGKGRRGARDGSIDLQGVGEMFG